MLTGYKLLMLTGDKYNIVALPSLILKVKYCVMFGVEQLNKPTSKKKCKELIQQLKYKEAMQ